MPAYEAVISFPSGRMMSCKELAEPNCEAGTAATSEEILAPDNEQQTTEEGSAPPVQMAKSGSRFHFVLRIMKRLGFDWV